MSIATIVDFLKLPTTLKCLIKENVWYLVIDSRICTNNASATIETLGGYTTQ